MPVIPKPVTRSDFRQMEERARYAIQRNVHGTCLCMAKDIIKLASKIDAFPMQLFPVFEMIDKVFEDGGSLSYRKGVGYVLKDRRGELLSLGTTFRELLIDHYEVFGEEPVESEDVSLD